VQIQDYFFPGTKGRTTFFLLARTTQKFLRRGCVKAVLNVASHSQESTRIPSLRRALRQLTIMTITGVDFEMSLWESYLCESGVSVTRVHTRFSLSHTVLKRLFWF
jgi:hypothetical protein